MQHCPDKTHFLLLILTAIILSSCGVGLAEIELPKNNPRLVVEGLITTQAPPYFIRLSLSQNLDDHGTPSIISNAQIKIFDDQNSQATIIFNEQKAHFEITQLQGEPGRTYFLEIHYNNKTYTSQAIMPDNILTKKPDYEYFEDSKTREDGYYITFKNFDPTHNEGYYRFEIKVNHNHISRLGLNDFLIRKNEQYKISDLVLPFTFKEKDTVHITTYRLNAATYNHYVGLLNIIYNDGGFYSSLDNPPTNISGDALGLFQTSSIVEHEIIIKP
jgi:hypothetical protein